MTKKEAKQKALEGFKVRHESWPEDQYVLILKGTRAILDEQMFVVDEDYELYFTVFGDDEGWEVVREPQLTIKEDVLDKILEELNELVTENAVLILRKSSIVPVGFNKSHYTKMREIIAKNLNAKIEKL